MHFLFYAFSIYAYYMHFLCIEVGHKNRAKRIQEEKKKYGVRPSGTDASTVELLKNAVVKAVEGLPLGHKVYFVRYCIRNTCVYCCCKIYIIFYSFSMHFLCIYYAHRRPPFRFRPARFIIVDLST